MLVLYQVLYLLPHLNLLFLLLDPTHRHPELSPHMTMIAVSLPYIEVLGAVRPAVLLFAEVRVEAGFPASALIGTAPPVLDVVVVSALILA